MPLRNGTGPLGQGPRTGRGFGNCCGRGWDRGFGWRRPAISPKEEKEMIEDELSLLKEEMSDLEQRLKELKKEK